MSTAFDSHKRGDSFARLITIPADFADGHFASWSVAAQLRDTAGRLISALACTWSDPLTTAAVAQTMWLGSHAAETDL